MLAVAGVVVVVNASVWLATWLVTRAACTTTAARHDEIPPNDLMFMLIALAGWSMAVPQMRRILVGGEDAGRERVRASLRAAARRLTAR